MTRHDPIEAAVEALTTLPSIHDVFVDFLERECEVSREIYESLYTRLMIWGNDQSNAAAINEFNPIMLLEQVRRCFDPSVDFVQFALAAADLQWGPRQMKIGAYERPVWVIALKGFPTMIEEARQRVALGDAAR